VVPPQAVAPLGFAAANISLPFIRRAAAGGGGGELLWQQHVVGPGELLPLRCEQLRLAHRLALLTDPMPEVLESCGALTASKGRPGWPWGPQQQEEGARGRRAGPPDYPPGAGGGGSGSLHMEALAAAQRRRLGLVVDPLLYSPEYLEATAPGADTGPDGGFAAPIPALRFAADLPSEGLQVVRQGLVELQWVSEHRQRVPVLVGGP
jgi:hypothetical protein